MTTVLFITWDGGGNVPPALDLAAELQRRGDSVRFLGHEGQRSTIEGRGFEFEPFTHAREWTLLVPRAGLSSDLAYAGVFSDTRMARDIQESIERHPTDYAVIDGLLVGAMAGAARAGLRYSILVHSLLEVMDKTLNHGPLALIMRLKGLNPRRSYALATRVLVVTLPELDRAAVGGDDSRIRHTGPTLTSKPSIPEVPPVVLVSLSTTFIAGQREMLQTIMDALAPLAVHGIVTTGPAVAPEELIPSANVEVHAFLPHAEIMPRASVLVGHGGHATTMLALAAGVPLLVLPMGLTFDQPTIGRRIEQAGAGLALPKSATAHQIRAAVERLLADASFRTTTERFGASIRSHSGVALAADALAESTAPSVPNAPRA